MPAAAYRPTLQHTNIMKSNASTTVTHVPLVILGSGMAGLGAGVQAQRLGIESLILEASNKVGGLCQNTTVLGCDFDFGPKILLLDNSEDAEDILSFLQGNYASYPVEESVYLSDFGLLGFPLQRHLIDLPTVERDKVLSSLELVQKNPTQVRNYKDWLRNSYGDYLCEHVLFPYEEKKWRTSLDQLDYEWAMDRPVRVDFAEVRRGAKEKLPPNKSYYYPKVGNISALSTAMARHAGPLLLNHPVTKIDLTAKQITTANGKRFRYDYLISSIPLDYAASITKQLPKLQKDAARTNLKRLGIRVFNVVFPGKHTLDGTAIYFAEKRFPFRRVTILENLCPALGRSDRTPISLEVSMNPNEPQPDADSQLAHMLEQLSTVHQFAHLGQPLAYEILEVDFAYPIQNNSLRPFVAELHDFYQKHDVYHCGRGGNFDYCNSDAAYTQGKKAALHMSAQAALA